MEENIYVEDDSNDRKYFSLFPHFVLNHSTAIDQSLYIQMKRYAGEQRDGLCWASKRTLMKKMGIGTKSLNKSIKYLLNRGWIVEKGTKKVMTKGGEQEVTIYSIKDIWKQNIDFYQGASESAYLTHKGASESSSRCFQKEDQGASESAPNKNHIKQEDIIRTSEQSSHSENHSKSSFIEEVIKAFETVDAKNKTYYGNKTQRVSADFLVSEYGFKKVIEVIGILPETNKMPYVPKINSPHDLKEKWQKLSDSIETAKAKKIMNKVDVII